MRGSKAPKVAIIQARTDSSRLASKCFGEIAGKRLLDHVIERALAIPDVSDVYLATSDRAEDDLLEHEAAKYRSDGLRIFRGSSDDVQSRFIAIGGEYENCLISRITADDPFRDPYLSDHGFSLLSSEPEIDYFSYADESLPFGLNCEVFRYRALLDARRESLTSFSREHVTPAIRSRKATAVASEDAGFGAFSETRLTVDFLSDLIFSDLVGRKIQSLKLGVGLGGTIRALDAVLREQYQADEGDFS